MTKTSTETPKAKRTRTRRTAVDRARVEAPRPGARFAEAYDPYATETKARAVAAGIPEDDAFQLAGIELACDAADAWAVLPAWLPGAARVTGAWVPLARALDRLELATRGSAMRKVKP